MGKTALSSPDDHLNVEDHPATSKSDVSVGPDPSLSSDDLTATVNAQKPPYKEISQSVNTGAFDAAQKTFPTSSNVDDRRGFKDRINDILATIKQVK